MPKQSAISFAFRSITGLTADVVSFTLTEGLSEPFQLDLELSSTDPEWPFETLLDQAVLFTIARHGEVERCVHGVVSSITCVGQGFRRGRYRLLIEPLLARAALSADWRIHQQLTLPQVIQETLRRVGITDVEFILTKDHDTQRFVMQPGETDLDFIHRQAAQAGMYYTFDHRPEGHRLMVSDRIYPHGLIVGGAVCFVPLPTGDDDTPCLWSFEVTERVRTARVTQRDYSQDHPAYNHESKQLARDLGHQLPDYEVYRYPGRYPGATDTSGKLYTDAHLMALRADARTITVEGNDARLQPGWAFDLEGHPRESWNRGYRTRRMVHSGSQITSVEEESADASEGTYYRYHAELLPDTVEWKPPHRVKPRMDGAQVATIVGPPNEEVWVDELGRVKVQFAWDRQGRSDENSSCWIDVAQGWAGATWGAMAIPRIGQEVTVDFWEGDCDRPYVSSRLHNAVQRPPYELPKFHALTPIRSRELKGKRSNELRLDDTSGQISAALMSDHAASALHLGYLTRPRPQGGEPRGEGFELRSDAFGAVRAGNGLLVSAYAQDQAEGRALDVEHLLAQVEQLNQQARELLELAHRQQAAAADHAPRDALVQALQALGAGANDRHKDSGSQPIVVTGAPAGVVNATPASLLQAAGANIENVAGNDHITTATGHMHLTAGQGIDAFTAAGGIRHLAGAGDITTQAQQGSVRVQASEDIRMEAAQLALFRALQQLVLQCQKAGIAMHAEGVIEMFCRELRLHGDLIIMGSSPLAAAMAEHWAVVAAPHPLLSECGVAVGAMAGAALVGGQASGAPEGAGALAPSAPPAPLAPAAGSNAARINPVPATELPPPIISPPTTGPLTLPPVVIPCAWHLKDIPPRNVTMDIESADYYMVDRNYQLMLDGNGQKQLMRYGGATGTFELRYSESAREVVATLRMALVPMEVRVRANANAPFEMAPDGRYATVPYNANDYKDVKDPVTGKAIYNGDRAAHPTRPTCPRDSRAPAPDAAALSKQAEDVLNADGYKLMRSSCGKGDACGCRVPVRFVVQVVNPKDKRAPKPHATVNVYEQALRADSGNWGEVAVQQVSKKASPSDPDYVPNPQNHVVAHEAGHLFSWPDEYYDNGGAIHRDCIENQHVSQAKVEAFKGQPRWQGMTDDTLMGYGVFHAGSGISPYYLERIAAWFQRQTGRPWRVVT